ncbi:reverse transcriptase family protein [Streptococcus dysgalactiae subsp. equisimilis]|nr:reverse transcriptase family protein [Streptococcus dysgalactiae subsp. equisimilis]
MFSIPKRGATCDPNNYRPISLTSTLSKVMELVIAKQLRSHLERRLLLNDRQYGFRCHRSTGDLLAYVSHMWFSAIDHHGESHLVSLDISKAFDRVWHDGLLAKLPTFGFSSNFTSWIRSFLSDRSISVRVDGVLSRALPVNSGVPQGSVLSPSLFLLFINDLSSLTSHPIHAFADDATLHCSLSYDTPRASSTSITDDRAAACVSLNSDLQNIATWGFKNRVLFNASKTSCLSVSRKRIPYTPDLTFDSTPLSSTPSSVILGLQFSSSLSWSPHILELASRASKKISYLFRARRFFTSSQLLTLYKAQIRPTLDYCSHVWGGAPSFSLSLLDRIQRKAIRLIADTSLTSTLQPLAHRRAVSSLSLFYRYYHGFCSSELAAVVPLPITFQRESRTQASSHPYQVSLKACRTAVFKSSFFPRTAILWNTLPYSVFPPSYNLPIFKSRINKLCFS